MLYCPKVSVIVPVYGVERFIARCAESLFNQTLDSIEFIFIDDCTKDNSMQILNEIIDHNRLRIAEMKWTVKTMRMPTNSGLPAVRRHGIQLAKGDYVIHCDSDDWVSPYMYEKLYNKAKNENVDIVYCDYYKSDGEKTTYITQNENGTFMLGPLWNKMVKRELYQNEIDYPTENKAEDGAIMLQLSFHAKSRGKVEEALYYYYQNPDSICHQNSEEASMNRLHQECVNTDLRIKFLEKKGISYKYKDEIVTC